MLKDGVFPKQSEERRQKIDGKTETAGLLNEKFKGNGRNSSLFNILIHITTSTSITRWNVQLLSISWTVSTILVH